MGFQGTLDTVSVDELVHWLMSKPRTGVLRFKRVGTSKSVSFHGGQLINAASSEPREYFGQFLVGFGMITEDQLQAAFDAQQDSNTMVGRILVQRGWVSQDQITRMLNLKVCETFLDLFLWEEGVFNYEKGLDSVASSSVPVAVDLPELFQKGIARRDAYRQIRQAIPRDDCSLSCNEGAVPLDLNPSTAEGLMVHMIRQGHAIADIVIRFHQMEFPVLKSLHEMVQRGWLTVQCRHPSEVPPPVGVIEVKMETDTKKIVLKPAQYLGQAQAALRREDYSKAMSILRHALAYYPYDLALGDTLDRAEKGLCIRLKNDLLSDNRVPFLNVDNIELDSAGRTPAERYLLARVNGKRSVRSIIMVSPLKEVQALQAFHSLIQAKLVTVR